MWTPEFMAHCPRCDATRFWFKANRLATEPRGEPQVVMGYKCAACDSFEKHMVDVRGRIWTRE